MLGIVGCPQKRKRLMAAIQSPPAPKAKQPFLPRTASQSAKGWGAHNANLHATIAAKQATTFACVPAGKQLASREMPEPCAADDYDMSFQSNELDAETYSMLHSVDGEFGGDRDRVVIGSLKKNVQFWEEIGAPKLVLEVINNGYTLPFVRLPRPRWSDNHKSTHEFPDFVGEAISDMRSRGCIKEVNRDQVSVCSPLGVVDNGKKLRLILDLRYLNKHLAKFKFKLEDLKVVADVYEKNDFLVTFDLKSGYHHIAIAESHWRYLGFSWVTPQGKAAYYTFCVLPFGLSTAPYIFTKVTRVLVRRWRAMGIRCQLYMDDGSGGHASKAGAHKVANQMKKDLQNAGFVANEKKCRWEPSQVVEMLGMVVDLRVGAIRASEKRVKKLKSMLSTMSGSRQPSAKLVARMTGMIMSMSLALGQICRLRTRAFYHMILLRKSWAAQTVWSKEAIDDLKFWKESFDKLHGQPFWKKDPRVVVICWSDASDTGWGGFMEGRLGVHVAKGEWPGEIKEKRLSSTWRELRAVKLVLESLAPKIAGKACIHRTDNQAAAHIIENGSRKEHLQEEAMAIHKLCRRFSVRIRAEWVPREENELADYYSKVVDQDDWQLNPALFREMEGRWGPYSLDCFASFKTKQLSKYCSRWWNPECFAIDAFTVDWSIERVWMVPPIYLISRTIDMLLACRTHGTLVVPEWRSAPWWPKLHDGAAWYGFVKECVWLPKDENTFLQGSCPWNLFGYGMPKSEIIALKLCAVSGCDC
eukprot:scpid26163/ scgid19621/ Retrovirus-related Pol polyprotein from transposon gypsy; Reverse transcriptase; Endonuclease